MNIYSLLEEQAKKYEKKPALIFHDQVVNFGDLPRKYFVWPTLCKNLGLKSNRLGVCLPNCPEFVYSSVLRFYLWRGCRSVGFYAQDRGNSFLFKSCRS